MSPEDEAATPTDDQRRWESIRSALGSIDETHEWDEDPAAWVHEQRFADERRVG